MFSSWRFELKTMLLFLVFINSSLTIANCLVTTSQWGVNGVHLSDQYFRKKIKKLLVKKGYQLTKKPIADFNMHLEYFGVITTDPKKDKTVGTELYFRKNSERESISMARSDQFIGSEKWISRRTLRKNIRKISKEIPPCKQLLK